ncbi:MAG: DUF998 domain-containing protein [Ferroplasma sp.]
MNGLLKYQIALYSGISAIVLIWIIIFLSAYLNPWFGITHNALSDLGGGNSILNNHPAPAYPYIYNAGLMITGVLIAIFAISAISFSSNKIINAGYSFFIISALFLALIGIYHEGTYPHDFVSIWFFILSSISYFVIAFGIVLKIKKIGAAMIIVNLLSWILYATIPWQSVAEDEIFGIAIIEILVILNLCFIYNKKVYRHY